MLIIWNLFGFLSTNIQSLETTPQCEVIMLRIESINV